MKNGLKIGIGIACMVVGFAGSRLDIDNNYHYFGTGTIFGVGLSLTVAGISGKRKEKKKLPTK